MNNQVMQWLKYVAGGVLAFIAPVKPMLWATLILVVADTITGVFAARAKGEAVTSAKFRRSIGKALVYTLVLVSCQAGGQYMLGSDIPVKMASVVIGTAELLSVLENSNHWLGGNLLGGLITRLGSPNDPDAKKGG